MQRVASSVRAVTLAEAAVAIAPARWLADVRRAWFVDARTNLLAGLVTSLALIPEVISFAIAAGVDPATGLHAACSISIVVALAGGRPGMISAAAGSMAVVVAPLVRDHGLGFLFATTVLTGCLQLLLGMCRAGRLLRFIPRPVVLGFVNGLAIIIFAAQLPHLLGEALAVWVLVAAAVAAIYALPRVTTAVPAPLVAIVVITTIAVAAGLEVPTVSDMGGLPDALPSFAMPDVPFELGTLGVIAPYAVALCMVGLLESLLTAQLVDAETGTTSDKDRECRGQGLANIVTGLLGGMPGCAMIGQTVVNVRSGGRSRLSTMSAGVFLLVLVVALQDVVGRIPMAALVGVMVVVAVSTFDWSTVRPAALHADAVADTATMAVTVAVIVATHNLAYGVLVGVALATASGRWARRRAERPPSGAISAGVTPDP